MTIGRIVGAVAIFAIWVALAYALAYKTYFWFLGIPSIAWAFVALVAGASIAGWYATHAPDGLG